MTTHPGQALKDLKPQHDFFIGIDSDGCAFDTMEIKHKECFIPCIVKYWDLQSISKYVREAAEFVNLYSQWRGINRWPAILMVFELLADRPEVIARNPKLPDLDVLRAFIQSGKPLSNDGLKAQIAETNNDTLKKALVWSKAVNDVIADMVHDVPPYPLMRESLIKMQAHADAIVVSQTPTEALEREWQEHGIDKYVRIIAGQEMGTKTEHIRLAAEGRYAPDKILMIGDAPGDYKAAQGNNACFFPINPGYEEVSWKRFHDEAFDRFIAGTFKGAYEDGLYREFQKYLPSTPPWKPACSCGCR
jgi:phosphoglycolate phosphatase-like HAD superfamily hydrolase